MLYWMDVLRIRAAQSTKHEYGSVACCEGVIFVTPSQFRIYLFLFPLQEKFCELGNQNHKFVIRNRRKERKEATIFSFSLQNFLATSVGEAAMYESQQIPATRLRLTNTGATGRLFWNYRRKKHRLHCEKAFTKKRVTYLYVPR